MTLNEKRIERRKIWESMKGMLDMAEKDKRAFSAEEAAKYSAMEADVDRLKGEIDKDEDRARKALEIENSFRTSATPSEMPMQPTATPPDPTAEKRSQAFRRYLVQGEHLEPEYRGVLQKADDAGGGYTVPDAFNASLIAIARNRFVVRGLASTFTLPRAESLTFPKWSSELGDATWTSELLTGAEDSNKPFGKVTLTPHPLARRAKISKTLVRTSALDVEALIKDALAYSVGRVEENAFLNGSGANQPLGVFTASAQGIDTDRDYSTGNTITEIRTDGLIGAYHTLHESYRMNASWLFHNDAISQIRKLKDGTGQYLWQPGIVGNSTDTILTRPVRTSYYAPNTFTTGLYVGILGDFSKYYIVDALTTTIQTLVELYAETNENGYIIRKESDGAPVLDEAFVRVALA